MPKTYIKWVGNKSKLIKDIRCRLPKSFNNYYEPFSGSAALFFNVAKDYPYKKYFLSDINKHLINCHLVLANNLDGLLSALSDFSEKEKSIKDFYEKQREATIKPIVIGQDIEAAARLIFLNRRAYGGMWRENSKGKFNVPASENQTSELINLSRLKKCSEYLRKANITCQQYTDIRPEKGDFVFLDPPYYPISSSSSFTAYTKDVWTQESHIKLMDFLDQLNKQGIWFLMTNNDCDFVRNAAVERSFQVTSKKVMRYIDALKYRSGRVKTSRTESDEIFVSNYKQLIPKKKIMKEIEDVV